MEIIKGVPNWFLQLSFVGLIYIVGKAVDYYKNQTKNDWEILRKMLTDQAQALTDQSKNINQLVTVVTVHEHRISDLEDDMKEEQGEKIVRYKRNGK